MPMTKEEFAKKVRVFKDGRGKDWFNIIPKMSGQLDVKIDYPGTIRAFHYHEKKTEWFFVVRGNYKFYLTNPKEIVYLSQGELIKIAPKRWHGYQALGIEETIILEYYQGKYDPQEIDDKRAPYNKFYKWKPERS